MRVALSASISSLITLTFSYPFDLLHTRMAAEISHNNHTRIYPSLFKCFNKSTIRSGIRGVYQGFQFTYFSQLIYFTTMFPMYEIVKMVLNEDQLNKT